jgi:hypothetical protein
MQVITHPLLQAYVAVRALGVFTAERFRADERGEGVISAAIAVLIMAFLGAAMWLAFKGIFNDASDKTSDNVNKIGS